MGTWNAEGPRLSPYLTRMVLSALTFPNGPMFQRATAVYLPGFILEFGAHDTEQVKPHPYSNARPTTTRPWGSRMLTVGAGGRSSDGV